MIVVDTNALVFWLLRSDRLSADLHARLAREEVAYCSVSLWEVALKQKQGRLQLPWTAREIAARLNRVRRVTEHPPDGTLWLESIELSWDHRDPADRLIVALATRLSCDLASTDAVVQGFYARTVR